MDEPTRSVFREKSLERLSTPKQFNDCLQVTKVNVWVALIAILVLLGGLMIWAVFGFVEITVKTHGIADNGIITCYVAGDTVVAVGMDARIDDIRDVQGIIPDVPGVITDVELMPANLNEIADNPAFSVSDLSRSDHSFEVTISAPSANDGIVDVTILRERVRPISFLTGQVL